MNTSQRAGAPSGPPGTTPATPTARSRKSAVLGVLVILIILALGVGLALWQNRTMPSTVRSVSLAASATAQAASVPAASASAPAAAASAADQATAALARADQALAAPAPATKKMWKPQTGDTLSGRFGKDAKAVCELNKLKNCNRIYPGTEYELPDGVEPRKVQLKPRATRPAVAAVPRAARPAFTRTTRSPEAPMCVKLGIAPFNPTNSRERQLEGIRINPGLTPEEKVEAIGLITAGPGQKMLVTSDMVFKAMPFRSKSGQVKFLFDVKVCTPKEGGRPETVEYWRLSTGTLVGDFITCGNIGPFWMPPPEKERDIPEPGQTTGIPGGGPVTTTPLPREPGPGPIPTAKPDKGLCERVEPEAALGQHHVPPQNGDRSRGDFLAFLVDCQRRLASDDGSWGVGVKGNASQWKGTANRGAGGYRGYQWLAQGSYREILDEGRNWNVGAGVGRQRESYREGAYASETTYHLVGVTAAYNDYRRRMAGETWNVEQQYFAGITVPTSAHMSQTWFGQPTDASGMPRLKVGVQAGGRWWIHETEDSLVLPYVEAGLFVQHPTSASGNVLVGIADRNRVCGIGIGVDKDLQNSGDAVGAWGWNCDLFQGGRVVRAKARERQIVVDNEARGVRFDRASGVMYVTDPAKFGAIAAPTE